MQSLRKGFDSVDVRVTRWMARHGIRLLRISLGVVFLWFGALKFFPGLSPAQDLATRTIDILTFGRIPAHVSILILATWECLIGLGLLFGVFLRATLLMLFLQMLGTILPIFFFPHEVFTRIPYAPNLEGQYIIKNVVLLSAGIVIGATVRGGAVVTDPRLARVAMQIEEDHTGKRQRQSFLALAVLAGAFVGAFGYKALPDWAPTPKPFSDTDLYATQYRELAEYVTTGGRPQRVAQVDLESHPKISQFTDIDSSSAGYGQNACGLVAAAAALGGEEWVSLVDTIAKAAGKNYGPRTGIQPSKYVAALQNVFGAGNVRAKDRWSLGGIYQELDAGNIVIVDIKVQASTKVPSIARPNYAHFARVLGLDVDKEEIYIENTLRGDPYWTVPLRDFLGVWHTPETTVSDILDPKHAENVTRWAVVIDGALIPAREP